jgi:integrase
MHEIIPFTHLSDAAQSYADRAVSSSTARAYTAAMADYGRWCHDRGLTAVPSSPHQVGSYLAALAVTHAVSTLEQRLSAISAAHRAAGHHLDTRHPCIRDVLSGIKRVHGTAQRQVEAATTDVVRLMVDACGDDLAGLRDRAILLLGFAGAMRRSELAALDVSDLRFEREGLRVLIRRSKTDQDGQGQEIGIASPGAIAAVQAWLQAAGIQSGRVFRTLQRRAVGDALSDQSVALIVKRRAEAVGLDPSMFSGHSLRAGFATSAAARGIEERIIQRTTRHVDLVTLRRYIRAGTLWAENASGRLGI